MREIKFRAIRKVKSVTGESIVYEFTLKELANGLVNVFFEDYYWLEYTGLKDKNGKEIYEGDIIKHSYRSALTVIEWKQKETQWSMGGYQSNTVEVIGNVYENSDLLTP